MSYWLDVTFTTVLGAATGFFAYFLVIALLDAIRYRRQARIEATLETLSTFVAPDAPTPLDPDSRFDYIDTWVIYHADVAIRRLPSRPSSLDIVSISRDLYFEYVDIERITDDEFDYCVRRTEMLTVWIEQATEFHRING